MIGSGLCWRPSPATAARPWPSWPTRPPSPATSPPAPASGTRPRSCLRGTQAGGPGNPSPTEPSYRPPRGRANGGAETPPPRSRRGNHVKEVARAPRRARTGDARGDRTRRMYNRGRRRRRGPGAAPAAAADLSPPGGAARIRKTGAGPPARRLLCRARGRRRRRSRRAAGRRSRRRRGMKWTTRWARLPRWDPRRRSRRARSLVRRPYLGPWRTPRWDHPRAAASTWASRFAFASCPSFVWCGSGKKSLNVLRWPGLRPGGRYAGLIRRLRSLFPGWCTRGGPECGRHGPEPGRIPDSHLVA